MTGISDNWERIWTPYRKEYNEQLAAGNLECPFCRIPKLSNEDSLILARGEFAFVVLNRYPYNPGHLLVCTFRHVGEYLELSDAELGLMQCSPGHVGRGIGSPSDRIITPPRFRCNQPGFTAISERRHA
ncbi:MAG: hypothetical protein EBR76_05675 [Actinobacteria bacterium]|nr:hypothetical protein [Actinomycetota bacterium]